MLTEHGSVWHLGVARLKDGVTAQQARDELNGLLAPLKETHAEFYGRWSVAVHPSARVPGEMRGPVLSFVGVLFLLTAMVLAIACSNVAAMLLARGMARRREIATRLAVGAGRGQLVAQLLTETAALFTFAATISVALAWWLVMFLQSFLPVLPIPIVVDLAVDVRVIAFALSVALATFGDLWPRAGASCHAAGDCHLAPRTARHARSPPDATAARTRGRTGGAVARPPRHHRALPASAPDRGGSRYGV
jgi:hypothetical protein